ncbi:MAG: hypothetical protein KDA83_10850, partial [Planctomycetales bacterium]|nr:hypothetical protein [Planctomycetales bacterium]
PSRPCQKRGKTKGNPKRERGILRLLEQAINPLRHQTFRLPVSLKSQHQGFIGALPPRGAKKRTRRTRGLDAFS